MLYYKKSAQKKRGKEGYFLVHLFPFVIQKIYIQNKRETAF